MSPNSAFLFLFGLLDFEEEDFAKRLRYVVECGVIGCESTWFLIFKCVRKLGEMVFGAKLSFPCLWIDPGAGVDRSN